MRSRKPGIVQKLHARLGTLRPVSLMLPWKEVEVLGAFISNMCYVDSVWIRGLEIGTSLPQWQRAPCAAMSNKPERSQQQAVAALRGKKRSIGVSEAPSYRRKMTKSTEYMQYFVKEGY